MSKKQKVSGFTLLELLVSITLTSLVFFIGQYIFSTFRGFTLTYDNAIQYTYKLSSLQHQIDRDLRGAKKWAWQEELQAYCIEFGKQKPGPCYVLERDSLSRNWEGSKVSWAFQGEWVSHDSQRQWIVRDTVHQLSLWFSLPKEGRVKP
ncbi:MAG: prepilin-type N-terminal cleavage/methylation domain-containing protein [Bacteroidota bacterium]